MEGVERLLGSGQPSKAGALFADAAAAGERLQGVRAQLRDGLDVGAAAEGDDRARSGEDAELCGLGGEPLGRDGAGLAHAQFVREERLIEGDEAVLRGEDDAGGAGEALSRLSAQEVIAAGVELAGGQGRPGGRLGAAAGGSARVRRFLRGTEREPVRGLRDATGSRAGCRSG
ncbi:hypothetical protein J7E93_35725 [Streptomyces sp. ISL-36]|nr:hypothetical protein [Streptomyces sp. ISL-36]MBT2445340.1 hypothetical protein [Streptomyces sp. ISL-36]